MNRILGIFLFMLFGISPEYLLHQAVTNHIFFIQLNMSDAFNILQDPYSGNQTTSLVTR